YVSVKNEYKNLNLDSLKTVWNTEFKLNIKSIEKAVYINDAKLETLSAIAIKNTGNDNTIQEISNTYHIQLQENTYNNFQHLESHLKENSIFNYIEFI